LFNILNDKKFNTVNSGQTLLFRASAGCSKFCMIKVYIQYSEFRAHCFSGQAQVVPNSEW